MRNILKIILVSLSASLVGVGLSRIGYINVILILAFVFFLTDNQLFAVSFAMVGGFIFDLLMHDSVGMTSLAILLGFLLYLGIKSLFSGEGLVFDIVSGVFSLFLVFAVEAGIDIVLMGVEYSSIWDFMYWWKYLLSHTLLIGVAVVLLGGVRGAVHKGKKIRL
jgi:hypothetical protein